MRYCFDEEAQSALDQARDAATEMNNAFIGTEHLLLGILSVKQSKLRELLKTQKVTRQRISEDLRILFGFSASKEEEAEYTKTMEEVLEQSVLLAQKQRKSTVDLSMLSQALFMVPNNVAIELLRRYEIDAECLLFQLKEDAYDALSQFAELRNLNEAMKKKKHAAFGREKELRQIVAILQRKEKANPLLVGEAGVGKTALAEELACLLNQQNVPMALMGCTIYELNLNTLVAGTKYRGEFEEKIRVLLDAVVNEPKAILFIDEVHQVLGAGKAEGSIDTAGVLKPYLARGTLRCIGATTYEEYRRYLDKDKALLRRFQVVMIEEPDDDLTCKMAEGKLAEYQKYHQVRIEKRLLPYLLQQADFYLPERRRPDKVFDLIDLSCIKAKMMEHRTVRQSDVDLVLCDLLGVSMDRKERIEQLQQVVQKENLLTDSLLSSWNKALHLLPDAPRKQHPLAIWHWYKEIEIQERLVRLVARYYFGSEEKLTVLDLRSYRTSEQLLTPFGYEEVSWIDQLRMHPYGVLFIKHLDEAFQECVQVLKEACVTGMIKDKRGRVARLSHLLVIVSEKKESSGQMGFVKKEANKTTVDWEYDAGMVFE